MTSGRSMAPAKRRTLGDEVADRLRDAILTGRFVAGEHLREENLAAMLQVSRGPIRDAFGALERDGLVVLSRHHGATVVELSSEDLEEVYSLRIVLETLAARYAVKRAQESDFELLTEALTTFTEQLAGHPTEQDAANLDVQFHDAFYRAAHHDRLYLAWSGIRLQVYRFLLTRNLANPDWRDNMARGHTDIVDVSAYPGRRSHGGHRRAAHPVRVPADPRVVRARRGRRRTAGHGGRPGSRTGPTPRQERGFAYSQGHLTF